MHPAHSEDEGNLKVPGNKIQKAGGSVNPHISKSVDRAVIRYRSLEHPDPSATLKPPDMYLSWG